MDYEFRIETGKVREFASSLGSAVGSLPETDQASVPATFLFTAGTFWPPRDPAASSGTGLGLDMNRILHAEEEFVFHGAPPRPGTRLRVSVRQEPPYEKTGARGGRLKFVELVKEFRDDSGQLVAECRSTLVETQHAPTVSAG